MQSKSIIVKNPFTFILIVFLSFNQTIYSQKGRIKGSKIVTMLPVQIENFSGIEVEDNLEIFLVKSSEPGIEIEADDNLHPFISYKIVGGNLRVSTLAKIKSFRKMSVRINYTSSLNQVIAKNDAVVTALSDVDVPVIVFKCYDNSKLYLNAKSSDLTLMANDKTKVELNLKSENANIDVSNNANVKALIASNFLSVDLYQKGNAKIEGDVKELKLRVDNNSDFEGSKLTADSVQLFTEGFSKSSVHAKTTIEISSSGKSEINLYGNPKIEMKKFENNSSLNKKETR